ncbi:MAG: histidine phosphatase family protein [Gammaproteobacteria bacterium]|nr:histidine phosphatase family protein [Gammaproteobacteria bacterium]
MTTFYLIRHGQASAGTDNYDRLSSLGQEQARLLGEWWQHTAHQTHASYSGDLERQQHTASITTSTAKLSIPHDCLPELNEYNHHHIDEHFGQGAKSDQPGSYTFSDYVATMQRWHAAGDALPAGVESYVDFSTRGLSALKTVEARVEPGSHVAIFTSGGVIATIVGQLMQFPFLRTMEAIWNIRNSSVTTLEIRDGSTHLIDYNTIAHLSVKSDPTIITLI